MNYLQFPQSKMQITAKIAQILSTKSHLTIHDLQKQHSPSSTKQALLRYGMAHQDELICRVSAKNKTSGLITTGYSKMRDVMDFVGSPDYQVMDMMPYGIFLDGFDYDRVIKEQEGQLVEKVGVVLRKKVRARLAIKDNKPGLVKKQSQASTNAQTDKNKKPAGHPNKEQPLHSKTLNTESKKQPEHKKQNLFTLAAKPKPEPSKPVKPAQTKRELKIASEPESEDEQKILEQFNISAPPRLAGEKVEARMGKIEEEGKMRDVERKIEEIDIDEEDAFELMLKKKGKVEIKAENKNTNFPQKIEKKTTQKQPSTALKPKPAQSQAEPKKSQGQLTLFGFMNKKMAP